MPSLYRRNPFVYVNRCGTSSPSEHCNASFEFSPQRQNFATAYRFLGFMRAITNQHEATCEALDQGSRFDSQPLQQIRQAYCLSSLRPFW